MKIIKILFSISIILLVFSCSENEEISKLNFNSADQTKSDMTFLMSSEIDVPSIDNDVVMSETSIKTKSILECQSCEDIIVNVEEESESENCCSFMITVTNNGNCPLEITQTRHTGTVVTHTTTGRSTRIRLNVCDGRTGYYRIALMTEEGPIVCAEEEIVCDHIPCNDPVVSLVNLEDPAIYIWTRHCDDNFLSIRHDSNLAFECNACCDAQEDKVFDLEWTFEITNIRAPKTRVYPYSSDIWELCGVGLWGGSANLCQYDIEEGMVLEFIYTASIISSTGCEVDFDNNTIDGYASYTITAEDILCCQ